MIPPLKLSALALAVAVPAALQSAQSDDQPLFATPANWDDFQDSPNKATRAAFRQAWSDNIERWTQYGIVGNPWTGLNDDNRDGYANPALQPVPEGAVAVLTTWPAFPHRLSYYGARNTPCYSTDEVLQLADFGYTSTGRGFPRTPADLLQLNSPLDQAWTWGPPRGWCDEYCEWSVHRTGEIIDRIDFTCENPEYWTTLWDFDRELMRSKIEEIVRYPVSLEDLYLRDAKGDPIVDVATGQYAYDPINKWNRGTISTPLGGGAIHLTSPPNSLGAEIYLAAAATIARNDGAPVLAAHDLINCSLYGGVDRNSDPHIGQNVNQVARLGLLATLQDPVGLYIQEPAFTRFELPADKAAPEGKPAITARDCWTLTRGRETIPGLAGNYGLHARFEVPEGYDFEINDIKIDGNPIRYAGQVAKTFDIGIHAVGFPGKDGPVKVVERECVYHPKNGGPQLPPGSTPQPAQPITGEAVYQMQSTMRAQLNFSPPRIPQGTSEAKGFVLPYSWLTDEDGKNVKLKSPEVLFYCASEQQPSKQVLARVEPGLALDQGGNPALRLTISVAKGAPLGNYSVVLREGGSTQAITPAPGMLEVVATK